MGGAAVYTIEHQGAKVDVQVERGSEVLCAVHCTRATVADEDWPRWVLGFR